MPTLRAIIVTMCILSLFATPPAIGNGDEVLMDQSPLFKCSTAKNYLVGKWVVRCPKNHDDTVDEGTAQHRCETCGLQVFDEETVTVVCPANHPNRVKIVGRTESIVCREPGCGKQCRRN